METCMEISEKECGGKDDFSDIYKNTNYAKSNYKNRNALDRMHKSLMVKSDEDSSNKD